jgi:predicted metal-dependent phosphotriesterase family hydrolase
MFNRRQFCLSMLAANAKSVQTVRGPVPVSQLGITLMHEHVLVNFTGATYDRDEAFRVALPKLEDLYERGCRTVVECTPDYIGRDVRLLRRLSVASGLHILTNTGYYAAANDKYVPAHAWKESPKEIAARWIAESRQGIEGTDIRPAFLKLGVDAGPLSEIDTKLIRAGLIARRGTRLRLHVHTDDGVAAKEVLALIGNASADAYVWVHAQNEKDHGIHIAAARAGAWIELDGVNERSLETHRTAVKALIDAGFLSRVLISQDSGWYRPGEPGGGRFNGYTFLFDSFLPALKSSGVSEAQIRTILVDNPGRVLTS